VNGELARALQPQVLKVEAALHDLDASNRDPDAHALDALTYTGRVIREQAALIDALWHLLDRRDPLNAECLHERDMAIQGRLNTLAALHTH
jgi:hypothetical protein